MLIRRSQRAARGDDVLFQKRTNGSRVSNSLGCASREYSPAGAQEAVRKDRDFGDPKRRSGARPVLDDDVLTQRPYSFSSARSLSAARHCSTNALSPTLTSS